jgi:hypothetical protein
MRYLAVVGMGNQHRAEDKIFKIIDNVLKQVFGENATLFIYEYLEQRYSLRKSEFSEKIDLFAKGLEDCLSSGAFAIETKILENIYSVYGAFSTIEYESKPERYDFASQLKIAMQKA